MGQVKGPLESSLYILSSQRAVVNFLFLLSAVTVAERIRQFSLAIHNYTTTQILLDPSFGIFFKKSIHK